MEIVSTYLSNEDAANCLSSMRELDKKAEEIAKTIVQTKKELQDLQSVYRFVKYYICLKIIIIELF